MVSLGLLSFLLLLGLWRGWRGGLRYLWLLWGWGLLCLLCGAGLRPLLLWFCLILIDWFISALDKYRDVTDYARTLAAAASPRPLLRCLGLLLCLLRRVLLLVLPLGVSRREEPKRRLLVPLELWILLILVLLLLLWILLLGILLLLWILLLLGVLLLLLLLPGHKWSRDCVEFSWERRGWRLWCYVYL